MESNLKLLVIDGRVAVVTEPVWWEEAWNRHHLNLVGVGTYTVMAVAVGGEVRGKAGLEGTKIWRWELRFASVELGSIMICTASNLEEAKELVVGHVAGVLEGLRDGVEE